MELLAPWHLVILAFALIALFGYKRLPEMSRSVARSLRIFKTEMKGLTEDDAARDAAKAASVAPVAPVAAAPPVVQPPAPTAAPVQPVVVAPVSAVPVVQPTADATQKSVD